MDLSRLPEELASLAEDNGGVLSRQACIDGGLTAEQVEWLVESGRWQSPFPRVLVTFSGPIPSDVMERAAVEYAGKGAALAMESAGAHWKLCAVPSDIHVMVSYEREVQDQPGLKIHRSRTMTAADVHPTHKPARLRIERTVCDLLRGRHSVDSALALAAAAVRTRKTTAEALRLAIRAKPKARWRRDVLAALPDVAAGAHSVLELHDARLRRRHGLPHGKRQFRRKRDGVEYLDVLVSRYRLHVELDGRLGHDGALESWRDMRRDNASEVDGLRHLRYGWADVLGRGCAVAIEQAVILVQEGWPGPFRRCEDCPAILPAALSPVCADNTGARTG